MKQAVDELLHHGQDGLPPSEFIRTAARSCLQEAEQAVTDFLGRGQHLRAYVAGLAVTAEQLVQIDRVVAEQKKPQAESALVTVG